MTTTSFAPGSDDKLTPTMIYTPQKMFWGQLMSKKVIRVSTWLQSDMAPKYIDLMDVQVMMFGAGQATKIFKFPIIHVETNQILAYHILPPTDESPYFDPDEPNRKMQAVTTIVGVFRFDCSIRIAEQSNLKNYLGVQKGDFLPIFDATMTCPLLPSIKGIQTPFVLVRQNAAFFATPSDPDSP